MDQCVNVPLVIKKLHVMIAQHKATGRDDVQSLGSKVVVSNRLPVNPCHCTYSLRYISDINHITSLSSPHAPF